MKIILEVLRYGENYIRFKQAVLAKAFKQTGGKVTFFGTDVPRPRLGTDE